MTIKCVLCGEHFFVGSAITYHSFPKDPDKRHEWLEQFPWLSLQPGRRYLCSKHFTPECFLKMNRTRLKAGSIPTVQLYMSPDYLVKLSDKPSVPSTSTDRDNSPPTEELRVPFFENVNPQKQLQETKQTERDSDSETITLSSPSGCESYSGNNSSFCGKRRIVKIRKKRFLSSARTLIFGLSRDIKNIQQCIYKLRASKTELAENLQENFNIQDDFGAALNVSILRQSNGLFLRYLKGPTQQKNSDELKAFAFILYYYSPQAYNYIRSIFSYSIPHPKTIFKWYKNIGGRPGFNKLALETIRKNANCN